jgi:hypothetical protein
LQTLDRADCGGKLLARANLQMDETYLFWKGMLERNFIHKEAKSMPGFKVCVRTLYMTFARQQNHLTHFSERIHLTL